VLDSSKTSSGKENDGKTSPSSHGSFHYRQRAEASSDVIAIMTSDTTKEGITTFNLQMFIFIMIMLLMLNQDQGIKKHLPFVVYLTIPSLSVGKE